MVTIQSSYYKTILVEGTLKCQYLILNFYISSNHFNFKFWTREHNKIQIVVILKSTISNVTIFLLSQTITQMKH